MKGVWLVVAGLVFAGPRPAIAQEPSLSIVLERAGRYVTDYKRQLSGIVAEEAYDQNVESSPGARAPGTPHRALKSDYLLVRLPSADRYRGFRDVFEVDARPVRDRQERLTRLFLDASDGGVSAFNQVATESARYNIGNVYRTMNTPTLALSFLDPDAQPHFRFQHGATQPPTLAKGSARTPDPSAPFRSTSDVWVVEYRETTRGTFIRTMSGRDVPSRGRFWIDAASGRVLMSELEATDEGITALVDVSYQGEVLSDVHVPIEMRERYDGLRDGSVITGIATYSRFRKFQVTTDESVAPRK